jgi:hypothetical protein
MTPIPSTDLKQYLEQHYNYQIVGVIDLDQLLGQPRKTLYKLFKQWYQPEYSDHSRIVLYSRNLISVETLIHIQKSATLLDISNFFILICSSGSDIDQDHLELVRRNYSTDDCIFSTLDIKFSDVAPEVVKNPAITLPDTFCFSPWAHLEISSQGEFRPCCVYKESITDSNNVPYNINTNSIEEVYHSDYLTRLRTQFLDGDRPAGCSSCWMKEQHKGQSNRQWFSDCLGIDAQCLDIEQDQLENLVSLDLKLGNLCNFACRICNSDASSKIAEEQARHFDSIIDLKNLNRKGQWVKNDQIWKMFNTLGNQLVNIDFYGGEPFLIKQQETFLDYLIEHDLAHKIRLHYNSNGSVYPAHLFEKWKLFRQVDIAFSIDNIGTRFELERGGKWDLVNVNLDKFLENKLPNMILSIFTTVNVQNVYYLDQLITWVDTKKFNKLNFNLLEHPKFLSITAMNTELTTQVIDKLSQIDHDKLIKHNVFPIIALLKQNKYSPDLIDELSKFMLKLDNIRDQKFNQTHPEIADIIYKGKYHG